MLEGVCWSGAEHFFDVGMVRMVKQKVPSASVSYRILLVIASLAFLVNVTHMIQLDDSLHNNTYNGVASVSSTVSNDKKETQASHQQLAYYRTIPKRKPGIQRNIVNAGDFIYYKNPNDWDAAPIVMESHKLVFFSIPKVGCTVWKQLFRRMMGYEDWTSQDVEKMLPHNPEYNGLRYLYDYSLEEASEMMTSPEWTRAMMVRDPKRRFLSSYLDKAVSNDHWHIIAKCCPDRSCVSAANDLPSFLRLTGTCEDAHWRTQNDRIDFKFWSYMDDIGHVETAAADSERLLKRIGAWEEFGASGWGHNGTLPIFGSKETEAAGTHSTYAEYQVWKYYTPEIEKAVERRYQEDFDNPLFNFTHNACFTCVS